MVVSGEQWVVPSGFIYPSPFCLACGFALCSERSTNIDEYSTSRNHLSAVLPSIPCAHESVAHQIASDRGTAALLVESRMSRRIIIIIIRRRRRRSRIPNNPMMQLGRAVGQACPGRPPPPGAPPRSIPYSVQTLQNHQHKLFHSSRTAQFQVKRGNPAPPFYLLRLRALRHLPLQSH